MAHLGGEENRLMKKKGNEGSIQVNDPNGYTAILSKLSKSRGGGFE